MNNSYLTEVDLIQVGLIQNEMPFPGEVSTEIRGSKASCVYLKKTKNMYALYLGHIHAIFYD